MKSRKAREQKDREENELLMDENDKLWSKSKLREQQMTLTKRKRPSDREEEGSNEYLVGRRRKKLKYEDDITVTGRPGMQEDTDKESPLMTRDCVYAAGGGSVR